MVHCYLVPFSQTKTRHFSSTAPPALFRSRGSEEWTAPVHFYSLSPEYRLLIYTCFCSSTYIFSLEIVPVVPSPLCKKKTKKEEEEEKGGGRRGGGGRERRGEGEDVVVAAIFQLHKGGKEKEGKQQPSSQPHPKASAFLPCLKRGRHEEQLTTSTFVQSPTFFSLTHRSAACTSEVPD